MNYRKIHDFIINKAESVRGKPRTYHTGRKLLSGSGLHLHHIIPRSMGGTDEGVNIAILTPREHYIIHWLLFKIHGGSMATAFRMMSDGKYTSHGYMSSKMYENLVLESMASRPVGWRDRLAEQNRMVSKTQKWIESNKKVLNFIHSNKDVRDNHLEAMKRRSENPEWRERHSEHLKRMHASDSYKKNHKEAMDKLRDSDFYKERIKDNGRKIKESKSWQESKRVNAIKNSIPVIGVSIDNGQEICIIGASDAKANGFIGSKITSVIKGRRNKHKGCLWRVATREDVARLRPNHEWLSLTE